MLKDDEIQGVGNSYTTEFRQYDARLGKWWSLDPVVLESESSYASNRNNPNSYSDPEGDCPNCPDPEFNSGIKIDMTFGKNGGVNLSLFTGVSLKDNFVTSGLNLSGTFYAGGVGTSQSSPILFNAVISPSLTFGIGDGIKRPLNTFNSFAGTGVYTYYENSISIGQNYTLSSGNTSQANYSRNQMTAFFGFTMLNTLTAGSYNDVHKLPFWGDGKDEFWSAGLNASININDYILSWSNDMYYGKSNNNATYNDDWKPSWANGLNYDAQDPFDMSLNNALETWNLTIPGSMFGGTEFTFGMGRSGRDSMWPSNRMHNSIHPKNSDGTEDKSIHFHHLFVPTLTDSVLRFGIKR